MERPDLSKLDPIIQNYIVYLEDKLRLLQSDKPKFTRVERAESEVIDDTPLPSEPPTTINILTSSKSGITKRTPRHLYTRQHRGGMGVFDLDVDLPDAPFSLVSAEEGQMLLAFTSKARAFRVSMNKLEESPVRNKGQNLLDRLPIDSDESLVCLLPEQAIGYVALVSVSGRVRSLRHHVFGEHMRPGVALYGFQEFGPLASACWTPGDAELFIITRNGTAIRFNEKLITPQGDWGIRISENDAVVGITSMYSDSNVFIVGADGRGTLRQMSGFAPNKSLGGSGKLAIRNEHVIGAVAVEEKDDLFLLSRLGKMIRFPANEVPPTEGVIQGVICMSLRGDEVVTLTKSTRG